MSKPAFEPSSLRAFEPSSLRAFEPSSLRAWLEHVAQSAIDWLDQLDAETDGLEDDDREDDAEGDWREWAP